jgi:hypothetical protein
MHGWGISHTALTDAGPARRGRAPLNWLASRQADGWAEGAYPAVDRWIGTRRPVWHDPTNPYGFRRTAPPGRLRGLLQLLPLALALLLVLGLFGLIASLATR